MDLPESRRAVLRMIAAAVLTAACFAANLGGAWTGGPANFPQFLLTAAYMLFWCLFNIRSRRQKLPMRISAVIGALTLTGAVHSFVMRLTSGGFILSAVLSAFASVPFYGLRLLLDWTPLYAAVSVLSLLWLLYALKNLHTAV